MSQETPTETQCPSTAHTTGSQCHPHLCGGSSDGWPPAVNCISYFLGAETSAWSFLKEWCHPMGEELVPGDLQRVIVMGSPGSDSDFGACVPLSSHGDLGTTRSWLGVLPSPGVNGAGRWNPAPLLWDLHSDQRAQPCPIFPQWF